MKPSIRRIARTNLTITAAGFAVAALIAAGCGGDDDAGGGKATAAPAKSGIVAVRDVGGMDVLADSDGRTLYSADVERSGRIRCTGGCRSFWDPVQASEADAMAAAADLGLKLGVVERPDGGRQLTLDGRPLYRFTQEGPGKVEGDGFTDDFGGTHFEWSAATTGAGQGSATGDSSGAPPSY